MHLLSKRYSTNYTGTLTDEAKTVFDSSLTRGDPFQFEFTLGQRQVIKGWDQSLLNMCASGRVSSAFYIICCC